MTSKSTHTIHSNPLTILSDVKTWSPSMTTGGVDMPCTSIAKFNGRYTQEHNKNNTRMDS